MNRLTRVLTYGERFPGEESILVSTDAPDSRASAPVWRLDTDNGSHDAALGARRPCRSQRQGDVGQRRGVPAGPARVHAARQDHRDGPADRGAAAHRRGAGHRQDDDGAPDGAQRRLGRSGQRPLHLLRARRAIPAQPPDRDGVGARPSAPQDGRDQDHRTSARRSSGPGWRRAKRTARWPTTRASGRRWTASPATARTCSSCAARRRRAPSTTSARLVQAAPPPVGRPAARGVHRLPSEGAPDPGAAERDREGHLHRQRAQGHRARRGCADGLHRRRRQGRA